MGALKVGVLEVWIKPYFTQRIVGVGGFLLIVHAMDGVYVENVHNAFFSISLWLSLSCLMYGISQLVSKFTSEGIAPCVAVCSVLCRLRKTY